MSGSLHYTKRILVCRPGTVLIHSQVQKLGLVSRDEPSSHKKIEETKKLNRRLGKERESFNLENTQSYAVCLSSLPNNHMRRKYSILHIETGLFFGFYSDSLSFKMSIPILPINVGIGGLIKTQNETTVSQLFQDNVRISFVSSRQRRVKNW